jgi:ABC-type multidrug transport system fused ATPase/permease subunit
MKLKILSSALISLILSTTTWFISSFFLTLTSPDRLTVSLLLFVISFLFGLHWSIIGVADTMPLIYTLYENETVRDLARELSRYKTQKIGRGFLIESTIDRALREITRSIKDAMNGKMEIRHVDFAAETYREALNLRGAHKVYATNFMPGAWTGPLGQAVIQGNAKVLKSGGHVQRIFLLGMTEGSKDSDAALKSAEAYIRSELEAKVGKKKTEERYTSKCVIRASERVHENYFIVDGWVVVKTEVDPSGRAVRLIIMESRDDIEFYTKEFETLTHERAV